MRLPDDVPALAREFIELTPDLAAAILLTMRVGWQSAAATPECHQGAHEVDVTERLRDAMRAALKRGQLPWSRSMIVASGSESRSSLEQLRPDGRTDIPIYLIEIFLLAGEHEPHAIVECKRIDGSDSYLCRQYVVEGIDRFRSGKYAENHAIGFMAGYLVSGDDHAAVSGINSYLLGQQRVDEQLAASHVAEEGGFWCSRHPRRARPPVELHHSFFELSSR